MKPAPSFESVRVPTIAPLTDENVFDEKDAAILGLAIKLRAIIMQPLVGDYCVPENGDVHRIGEVLHDRVQMASRGGSFHLHDIGTMSHSGGRGDVFFKDRLLDTGITRSASAWAFHHGRSGAGRGVDVIVPVRVWEAV